MNKKPQNKNEQQKRETKTSEPQVLYATTKELNGQETKIFASNGHQQKAVLSKSATELLKQINFFYKPNEKLSTIDKISDFEFIHLGTRGVQKEFIDVLANDLGITRKAMAEDILNVSVKTMERKTKTEKLDKRISSHALEVAKVLQHAFEVFENEEKVKRWVNKENRALNDKKPVELFDTLTGINMVSDILVRIEEGVYS
jgi:putative toxin-antitoxin system antitoxin component (TIGR02293 family)